MAYIKRIGYKHLYTIRFQVIVSLGMIFKSMRIFNMIEWANKSMPEIVPFLKKYESDELLYLSHNSDDTIGVQNYAMLLNTCLEDYELSHEEDEINEYFWQSMKSTSLSDHSDEDYYGTELGGEWDIESFIIRSGIVLTIGVLEEFERGVIKILTIHGTKRGAKPTNRSIIKPRLHDFTSTSEKWKKVEKKTHTIRGRRTLLREYDINANPGTEWNIRLSEIRNERHKIVHGVKVPQVTFRQFLILHYDIYKAIKHLADEILGKQQIEL